VKNMRFKKTQRGLSLIELMVAITIGLLLLAGVIQVFASTKQTYRVHEGLSRVQESGRFAMEFLTRDLRMAGFFGCAPGTNSLTNHLNFDFDSSGDGTDDSYSEALFFNNGGIEGTDDDDDGISNSDRIVIRGAFGAGLSVLPPPPGSSLAAAINTAAGNGLLQGNIVMVSDCQQADVFQITNANPGTSGTISHGTGTGTPGNATQSLSKIYREDAQIYRTQTMVYTIENGTDNQPALFRNGVELVSGINSMQVLYGEDTNASGTANYYVPASNMVVMENVVSVQISLLVQSDSDNLATSAQSYTFNGATSTAMDNRLYQVFTSTITLRNRVI